MIQYKDIFDAKLGVKSEPNLHESELFERARKYIGKLTWIPGLEMIAVVNSLSMFATHKDSDIDLFIVTKPGSMWLVRLLVTGIFSFYGVWRRGKDIRGNFCLSFFVTTDFLHLHSIALEEDIYLYFWIYHLKPIAIQGDIYERFLEENLWVQLPQKQQYANKKYITYQIEEKGFSHVWKILNFCIQFFGEKKARFSYRNSGKPYGIIIEKDILKFHREDQRRNIRDDILGNKKYIGQI